MEQSTSCPTCGGTIVLERLNGLCPSCLLNLVREIQPATQGWTPDQRGPLHQSSGGQGPRRQAPSLDQVRANFPNLEVIELIGHGGMGAVYLARQKQLDRLVALKILPAEFAERPGFTERFQREGQMLARLDHPNIVRVYEFGQSSDFHYLLLEYVDGVNLRALMQAEKFAPARGLEIVPKICEALQYAHGEGILHRDIKPENILIDTRGRVKITDFGIAKFQDVSEPKPLTRTGVALGTPHYMAPEQIERPGEVDHRADIFSLGVVFYEMLTGELPLGRFSAPSHKAKVDPRIDEIVFQALAKEKELRQRNAHEVKTQVETIASQRQSIRNIRSEFRTSSSLWQVFCSMLAIACWLATIYLVFWGLTKPGYAALPDYPIVLLCAASGATATAFAWLSLYLARPIRAVTLYTTLLSVISVCCLTGLFAYWLSIGVWLIEERILTHLPDRNQHHLGFAGLVIAGLLSLIMVSLKVLKEQWKWLGKTQDALATTLLDVQSRKGAMSSLVGIFLLIGFVLFTIVMRANERGRQVAQAMPIREVLRNLSTPQKKEDAGARQNSNMPGRLLVTPEKEGSNRLLIVDPGATPKDSNRSQPVSTSDEKVLGNLNVPQIVVNTPQVGGSSSLKVPLVLNSRNSQTPMAMLAVRYTGESAIPRNKASLSSGVQPTLFPWLVALGPMTKQSSRVIDINVPIPFTGVTEMVQNELLKNWRNGKIIEGKGTLFSINDPIIGKHQVDLEFVTPTSEKAVVLVITPGLIHELPALIRSKLQPYKRVYLCTFIKTANENNQVGKLLLDAGKEVYLADRLFNFDTGADGKLLILNANQLNVDEIPITESVLNDLGLKGASDWIGMMAGLGDGRMSQWNDFAGTLLQCFDSSQRHGISHPAHRELMKKLAESALPNSSDAKYLKIWFMRERANVEFELATKLKSLGEKHPEVSTLKAKREFIDRVLRELAQPNPRLLNLFESSQKKP